MLKNKDKSALAKLALFFTTIIWGSSFVVMKNTVDILPVFFLLAVRFSIAFAILGVVFAKRLKGIDKKYILHGSIIGLWLFLGYATQTIGITETTPGKNAFLSAIGCVIVPFLFWLTDKVKPDIYNILAALLCISGIGFVSISSNFTINRGDLITMICGFFFAAHIVSVKRFSKGRDPIILTIIQFAVCSILSLVTHLIAETKITSIAPDLMGEVLYLSIVCTAIALLLQTIGQKYTAPTSAAIILSLESVFGVIFSIILYEEVLTPRLIIGFVFIFLSIIISETKLSFLKKSNKET